MCKLLIYVHLTVLHTASLKVKHNDSPKDEMPSSQIFLSAGMAGSLRGWQQYTGRWAHTVMHVCSGRTLAQHSNFTACFARAALAASQDLTCTSINPHLDALEGSLMSQATSA